LARQWGGWFFIPPPPPLSPPPVWPVDRCVVQEEEGGETETDGVTDGLDQGSLGLGGGG
jgi:hypothetical protein